MKIRCAYCGRDIDAIGQDNMSYEIGKAICEDCYYGLQPRKKEYEDFDEEEYWNGKRN